MDKKLDELRKQALFADIPIMEDDALIYLGQFLEEKHITSLLEIGTAVGYSSCSLCNMVPNLNIVTIERDEERYKQALVNIHELGFDDRIKVINADARKYDCSGQFEAILLDGPKAHNQELLDRYLKNLLPKGYIVVDDVYFHGFLDHPEIVKSRSLKVLVRKFKKFRDDLMADPDFVCTFMNIGDGLLIAQRREENE